MHQVTHIVHKNWKVCFYAGFGDPDLQCDHPDATNPLCNPICPKEKSREHILQEAEE